MYVSLSLSLYIYIYVHTHNCRYIYIYISSAYARSAASGTPCAGLGQTGASIFCYSSYTGIVVVVVCVRSKHTIVVIWGCYDDFTNYNFKHNLYFQTNPWMSPLWQGMFQQIKLCYALIVGEIIVKSPY